MRASMYICKEGISHRFWGPSRLMDNISLANPSHILFQKESSTAPSLNKKGRQNKNQGMNKVVGFVQYPFWVIPATKLSVASTLGIWCLLYKILSSHLDTVKLLQRTFSFGKQHHGYQPVKGNTVSFTVKTTGCCCTELAFPLPPL